MFDVHAGLASLDAQSEGSAKVGRPIPLGPQRLQAWWRFSREGCSLPHLGYVKRDRALFLYAPLNSPLHPPLQAHLQLQSKVHSVTLRLPLLFQPLCHMVGGWSGKRAIG